MQIALTQTRLEALKTMIGAARGSDSDGRHDERISIAQDSAIVRSNNKEF
jgi:hypothetical protein